MLTLPQVTIISIDCAHLEEAVKAIRYSCRNICFKEAILFTDTNIQADGIRTIQIDKLTTIDQYSDFVLRLSDYIDSDYVLIVQNDGFILNVDMWSDEFLQYDYIGAVWPLEQSWIERQQTSRWMVEGFNRVGNGGFSLRSRKFLELSSEFKSCNKFGEDAFLNIVKYKHMLNNNIFYPPIELANRFSRENNLSDWTNPGEHNPLESFGFHGKNFSNHRELIALKG